MEQTNRLYYDNSYLKEFDGRVTACRGKDGRFEIALDQSAFYPTSGGQPYDTGRLACGNREMRVEDVFADQDGVVWHVTDQPAAVGTVLHGRIDWERRFDHMQQHGGEHMLAGAVWRLLGGATIGLHLGRENSSIDVTLPEGRTHLEKREIHKLEEQANVWIQQDDAVKCWFPDAEELAALPLRKQPTVKTHIRIVAFGDYEMVACGGTHPASAGQVGLVKILSVAPAKGKARITFVCGMRAFRYFCLCQDAAEQSGRLLSCPVDELPGAVERLKAQALEAERRLCRALEEEYLGKMRDREENGLACLWIPDGNVDALRAAAAAYIRQSGKRVLCGGQGRLIFARSQDAAGDMAALMRSAAHGGGKADFAAGAGDEAALQTAREMLTGP